MRRPSQHPCPDCQALPRAAWGLALAAVAVLAIAGCADEAARGQADAPGARAAKPVPVNPYVVDWNKPGIRVRVLNPGAKHLDVIITHDSFNHLFPNTVWFNEGDVEGMYNRNTQMTFIVVSEHAFNSWTDELSAVMERVCHEKAHRADDLYDGDMWSELRDTSSPGLELDTHHYGHVAEDETHRSGIYLTRSNPAGTDPRLGWKRPVGDPAQLPPLP